MATPGEMIRIVAEALALPTATVTSYHRVLRQAGLVTHRAGADAVRRP